MKYKAVLFDLDGTLLPMDNDLFTKGYFKYLVKTMAPHGYEPESLIDAVWKGTASMVKNDGSRPNEEAFWETFGAIYGEKAKEDYSYFDEFYRTEFAKAKEYSGFNPLAAEVVYALKAEGVRVALATNPIFPAIATEQRIEWAGLKPADFEFYTTYETIGYSKPNPEYYRELLRRLELSAEDCLMVGNDVGEDMIAKTVGMDVFLLTDNIINRKGEEIDQFPHGSFEDLKEFLGA